MSFDCIGAFIKQDLLEAPHGTIRITGQYLAPKGQILLPGELALCISKVPQSFGVYSIHASSSSLFNASTMPCIQ